MIKMFTQIFRKKKFYNTNFLIKMEQKMFKTYTKSKYFEEKDKKKKVVSKK